MSEAADSALARVPTGIAGFDTILRGGFFRGGLYILQGTPGTGKTTLANQICFHRVAAGEHALYVTLLAEYHSRMIQHLRSMSFFDISKIPGQISYLSGFGTLRQDGSKALLDMLRREIAASSASILVLDGFATAQRAEGGSQNFNEFVHELQGIATGTDCTMFLLTSANGPRTSPEYTIVDGIVELSDELIGWTAESTLQVVKLRGSDYLRGRHAFRITDDGLVFYPRIEALLAKPTRADNSEIEKVPSGIARLDSILGGGLPAGSTTLIIGPTGVGKTTLGLQFLAHCSADEPGLLFGFYETPARIAIKAREICPPLRAMIDNGTVEVLWQPPTDALLDAYGDRLIDAVHRQGTHRLFIDGLGALRRAATDPVRLGQFLNALTNELRVLGVTTVYTLEVPDIIGPQIKAPIDDLSSLAENMILMRFVELRSRLHRIISILKVRDSNFDMSLYQFATTERGLSIEDTFESAEAIMTEFSAFTQRRARPGREGAREAQRLVMATVLVVDDEFGIAELFEAILVDAGHTVLAAINGRQGLDIIARTRPDLIFLDYMMPVMTGAAMLQALNADPTLRGIPVVLMSSLPEAALSKQAPGYVAFMRKPFKVDQVMELARRLVGHAGGQLDDPGRSDANGP